MPSTLPLSVTGFCVAVRPARISASRRLLHLGLACLLGCLPPPGGALGIGSASQAADGAGRLRHGVGPLGPLADSAPAAEIPAPAGSGVSTPQPAAVPRPVPPANRATLTAPGTAAAGSPATSARPGVVIPPGSPIAPVAPVVSEAEFQQQLRTGDLDRLNLLCGQLVEAGDDTRLRLLRERLLTIHPAPQPLAVVLANAEVLLSCRMPDGALTVLDRIGPARGAEQVQWLTLQWRAANAALDHRRAALALERLSAERPDRLEGLLLPLQQRSDGSWASRSALEAIASHLESAGQTSAAASLLLLTRNVDAPAAERLAQAARLLADLPTELREPLFERALEQAAAVGSWGLVGELLAAQAALPASPEAAARTAERRLRLSRRLDDAYGEWRALQATADPASAGRRQELLLQLRSPRRPGGHAESLPAPTPLPPLFSEQQARSGAPQATRRRRGAPAPPSISPPTTPAVLPPSGPPAPSLP